MGNRRAMSSSSHRWRGDAWPSSAPTCARSNLAFLRWVPAGRLPGGPLRRRPAMGMSGVPTTGAVARRRAAASSAGLFGESPLLSRHSLIIPKSHYSSLDATPPLVIAAMCSTIPLLSNAIMKATKCNSFNLLVNSGAAAGQVVFHTHLHIIPRKDNDCLWTSESSLRKPLKLSQETVNLANRIRQQLPFPKCNEINGENHEPKLDENS
ncbi:hypothetical protein Taro_022762 [Colocasia esculenta]|uniref:HIT domain-containing protein n=1 Tax=Colocasia esculenta TaxID=4460 RepID=A0A843V9B6_COLES|nr:hypothetical protein [Colocasia esculenta]